MILNTEKKTSPCMQCKNTLKSLMCLALIRTHRGILQYCANTNAFCITLSCRTLATVVHFSIRVKCARGYNISWHSCISDLSRSDIAIYPFFFIPEY